MALTDCKECGRQVSDKAAACPSCGCPIALADDIEMTGTALTTTQLTAKRFKVQVVGSNLLILAGALIAIAGGGWLAGGVVATLGLVWYGVVQYLAWWHHG
jgi:uncharacterized OB-fold protein